MPKSEKDLDTWSARLAFVRRLPRMWESYRRRRSLQLRRRSVCRWRDCSKRRGLQCL